MLATKTSAEDRKLWALLEDVPDPEIPVVSIVDLGIVRFVRSEDHGVVVGLSPTYSACPATEVIEQQVAQKLRQHGYPTVAIQRVLSPAWTTDWISEAGRDKLREFGISPPVQGAKSKRAMLTGELAPACPRCGTTNTEKVSEFGSTPCKASYKCSECLEPFDYFKCI